MRQRTSKILGEAAGDLLNHWKPLFATDVAVRVAAFVVLAPLTAVSLRLLLWLLGVDVVADKDIAAAILSPSGLAGFLGVAAVVVGFTAIEIACLLTIAFGSLQGKSIGVLDALAFAGRAAGPVLRLAIVFAGRTLLWTTPFAAAIVAIAWFLLTEYDINFYLTATPPEFWLAVGLAGGVAIGALAILIPRWVSWSLALPIALFEGRPTAEALQRSIDTTRGHRLLIGLCLTLWAGSSVLVTALTLGAVRLFARIVTSPVRDGESDWLLLTVGAVAVLWVVANEVLAILVRAALSVLGVRLYAMFAAPESPPRWAQQVDGFGGGRPWNLTNARLAGILVGGSLGAAVLGTYLVNGVRMDTDVQIIAHRGAAAWAPENTLSAVERAIADGADWAEIDVLETVDGEVVVVHDRDLMRVGGVGLEIADSTAMELRAVDVGSWFAPEFADQRVPLLREVLELARGRIGVNIELKHFGRADRLEERVVEIVEELGMEDEIVAMSLSRPSVETLSALRPDWRVGLITAVAIGNLTRVDVDFFAVNGLIATPAFIHDAHSVDKEVYVWPIYDGVEKARMISRGADGLITNDPAEGRRVLAALEAMSTSERLLVDLALWIGLVPDGPLMETNDLEGQTF